jgi:dihydroorotase
MMALLLKNVHAVDPQVGLDEVCDILIEDGKISQVGKGVAASDAEVRDLSGKYCVPGLVDVHVHFRDPGLEYKEDIETGSRAAAHGGFTDVCCMPNTKPVIDTGAVVEYVRSKASKVARCRVHVSGACTVGEKGEALSEMGDMVAHGAVAFTDDGRGVQGAGMMRRVMDYAAQFGKVVMSHCQDEDLVDKGQVNEGVASTRLALQGWPAAGEEIQIERDIEMSRLTGCPIHIQHLTTAHGIEIVRRGKEDGVAVTCEVTPHHMFLSEDDITDAYETNLKVNPPLRTKEDAKAIIRAVVDGTVDCIVTDHAPHAAHEKDREFELAPFGMTGLETSLSSVLTNLVNPGVISWQRMVELMSVNPRALLRIQPVKLQKGSAADITIIDPDVEWDVTDSCFESKSSNSGFIGKHFKGKATDVYVGGTPTLLDGVVTDSVIEIQ